MELWDLYTRDRELTGKTMVRGDKIPEGCYHLVIHICAFNSRGEMLIQQRQSYKEGWSNLWDITVGGSSVAGESSRQAAERELGEEVGISFSFEQERPALTLNINDNIDDYYLIDTEPDITTLTLQQEEVQAVKWATLEEILQMIDDEIFIPYHKSLIETLFALHKRRSAHYKPDPTR